MKSVFKHLQGAPGLTGVYQEQLWMDQPFERLAEHFVMEKGAVLLLSGASSDAARYHILAIDPWLELTSRQDRIFLRLNDDRFYIQNDPLSVLSSVTHYFSLPDGTWDFPVHAGLFGYLSYDLKDCIERLPNTCQDTYLPDMMMVSPSIVLVFDKQKEQLFLLIPFFEGEGPDSLRVARKRQDFFEKIQIPVQNKPFFIDANGFRSSMTKEEYIIAVKQIIAYLKAGDIYQANLSQRFETGFTGNAFALFLDLYKRNPAAFFSYINAGDHKIVSTSPERFIQQTGRHVETRPIKGTIARGETNNQDKENRDKLGRSIKDDAELTMIVDLMRNDLSRVTRPGSVVVKEHKRLEPYENVFHLVSIVQGELDDDKTSVDLIRATFPGGSITGCPKIRSMEIIDELESVKRHVYTGSIGYISFHDTMDLSIAIRTATITDDQVFFSVGGGIVYDSDPQKEYQETLDKGKTLMDALSDHKQSIKDHQARWAWVNGKIVAQETAVMPLTSLGCQYGAGLFETIKVEKNQIFRLSDHVDRLNRSWKALFSCPPPDITWEAVIRQLIKSNQCEDKILAVKLMVAVDQEGSGSKRKPAVYTAALVREYTHRLAESGKSGLDLIVYPHPRQTLLADYKTMNYLYYYQAGQHARANGADEAIILNPDQTVSETNTANILAIQDRKVIVPESDHVLGGVTVNAVLNVLTENGFDVCQKKIGIEQLQSMTNVVLTNSLMGAVRVLSINKTPVLHDSDICEKLNAALF
jgi:para-aminobenzoate synthetase component 1